MKLGDGVALAYRWTPVDDVDGKLIGDSLVEETMIRKVRCTV